MARVINARNSITSLVGEKKEHNAHIIIALLLKTARYSLDYTDFTLSNLKKVDHLPWA